MTSKTSWSIFGPPRAGRTCGSCKYCCIVVPVQDPGVLMKPGGVRCEHLKGRGCGIYKDRPNSCATWSCTWLYQPEAAILRRPDLSGYAVDPIIDFMQSLGRLL
jgi:Pyruvate/2-oxoacid:ferredoxin oxidoreductase delta subunit